MASVVHLWISIAAPAVGAFHVCCAFLCCLISVHASIFATLTESVCVALLRVYLLHYT